MAGRPGRRRARGHAHPARLPAPVQLSDLVAAVRHAVALPVIAAGGIATAADVTAALRAGAVAAMADTVLVRSQESGPDRGSGRCCGRGCLRWTQPGELGAT
ncbi:nitronate monooxygenase [Streptomyces sp. NPDC093591]|uniref:nitronate monooxygenase n=1 Tax=Streptomyces sp. NPDC093591 TaxID=3366044 RepID=UPI003808C77C